MKNNSIKKDLIINRRQVIKAGLVGGASLLMPWHFRLNQAYGAESPALEHFVDELPIPRVFRPVRVNSRIKKYRVRMRQIRQKLHRDMRPTTVWGYGDRDGTSYPGPTFEAFNGDNVKVKWINRLSRNPTESHYLDIDPSALKPNIHGAEDLRKAVVHLHGGHIPMAVDGDPYATILPGSSDTYTYPIRQQAATLWYHDHSLGITRLNVYMGLAGFFLVRDENEIYMQKNGHLPAAQYEIPLVLQDRIFKPNGKFSYDRKFGDMFLGDVQLVNGKVWPYLDVERRRYRFRLLNGANSRAYTLKLPEGISFHQIGTDGGFLPNPVEIKQLTLTPGERADIIIDFSKFGVGDEVVLENVAPPMFGHPGEEMEKDINDIMLFRVTSDADPTIGEIELLHELVPDGIASTAIAGAISRDFFLEDYYDANVGDSKWLINGLGYDDITEKIEPGATEVWNFVNKSEHLHPMHLHLVQFQVLSRQKQMADDSFVGVGIDPNERGWKDTVRVGSKETVSVAVKFPDDPELFGTFPYHCHILEHEDHEMMRQFQLG